MSIGDINALLSTPLAPPALAWTSEAPTVAGDLWWVRIGDKPPEVVRVVLVEKDSDLPEYSVGVKGIGESMNFYPALSRSRWAGPLTPPPE